MALYNLGELAWARHNAPEAKRLWEECLLLDQAIGVKGGSVLGALAQVAESKEDFREAQRLWNRSLAEHQEIGDRKGMVECLEGLAYLAAASAQPERAARLFGAAALRRETLKRPCRPVFAPGMSERLPISAPP